MHPTPTFAWTDRAELLAFVTDRAFATVVAHVGGQLAVAQVPVLVSGDDALLLHMSRANAIARALPCAATVIVHGPDAYISPDWYEVPDQVPTWNYVSAEISGALAPTDDTELLDILAREAALFERRIPGKPPWTLADMSPAELTKVRAGITGARLTIESYRGTRKLSQNKPPEIRARVATALGDHELAQYVRRSMT